MKLAVIATILVVVATSANARLVSEIDKDIAKLRNEATKLNKHPIVVWGSKQDKLSPEQKCATSRYNINLAQAKERKNYKSKTVITLNPEYVCSIHKKVYVDGRVACPPECKSIERIGTSNFCNLGAEYDLSFRSWNLLKEKMPDGEIQEERLTEIEKEISILRDEKREVEKQNPKGSKGKSIKSGSSVNQAEHVRTGSNLKTIGGEIRNLKIAGVEVFGKNVDEFVGQLVQLGGKVQPSKISGADTTYVRALTLPPKMEFCGVFDEMEINVNSKNEIRGLRLHARTRIGGKSNDLSTVENWLWKNGLDKCPGFRKRIYLNAHGYWTSDMYVGIGISIYEWLFIDFVREDLNG